ncbi:hypothetical protein Lser_V15G05430 [Lactuca serriola]|uniref:Uncharacterized protein n=2 Tax=Lactuca TaxID=4235 RepID=A0AA35VKW8_LACSI|nr:hypothetical protein LSAT_V11C200058730 [Lactuca sativa]CAI9270818.1 unnamed protein product [Lactuca saligna]
MASPQDATVTASTENPGVIGNICQTVTSTFTGAKDAVMGKAPEAPKKETTLMGQVGEYTNLAGQKTKEAADATGQKAIETKDFIVEKAIAAKDFSVLKAQEAHEATIGKKE